MKSFLAAVLIALLAFVSTPAFAKAKHLPHKKGTKIAKHFSPHRAAKLRKWQQGEIKRKSKRRYTQFFSHQKPRS